MGDLLIRPVHRDSLFKSTLRVRKVDSYYIARIATTFPSLLLFLLFIDGFQRVEPDKLDVTMFDDNVLVIRNHPKRCRNSHVGSHIDDNGIRLATN